MIAHRTLLIFLTIYGQASSQTFSITTATSPPDETAGSISMDSTDSLHIPLENILAINPLNETGLSLFAPNFNTSGISNAVINYLPSALSTIQNFTGVGSNVIQVVVSVIQVLSDTYGLITSTIQKYNNKGTSLLQSVADLYGLLVTAIQTYNGFGSDIIRVITDLYTFIKTKISLVSTIKRIIFKPIHKIWKIILKIYLKPVGFIHTYLMPHFYEAYCFKRYREKMLTAPPPSAVPHKPPKLELFLCLTEYTDQYFGSWGFIKRLIRNDYILK